LGVQSEEGARHKCKEKGKGMVKIDSLSLERESIAYGAQEGQEGRLPRWSRGKKGGGKKRTRRLQTEINITNGVAQGSGQQR